VPANKDSQRTNEARSQVNNFSEINDKIVVTKKISRNQTSSAALEGKTAYYNTKERFEVKNDDAQVAFEILNSASSSKSVDPLKSNAQSTISKSSLSVSSREEIYFPFLSTPLYQEVKPETRVLQPTIASLVKPVRKPLGIELSLAGNYGYRLGTASRVNSRGFGKIENATTSFVDVSGVELGITVPLYKRILLGVGVNYNRFTDKSVSVSETKITVESLANNGFDFKTETYELNAFHHTDIVDLQVEFVYAASHGKWSFRPTLGVNYNVYNNIITKSLDGNVATFESQDVDTYTIQKSNTSESLSLGYFGSVTAGYSFTPMFETFAGLKYQSSRNIGAIKDSEISSHLTGSIQGTAGMRFRF